jgi:hypoxanthine phosphoribosyltransferase
MTALPAGTYEDYAPDIREILFPAEEIERRVLEMGAVISRDYAGRVPLLIGVLKGVVPFMADLLRAITIAVEVDYMAIASYSAGSRDGGMVRMDKDLNAPVYNRHLLFIEDVIDSGLTLNYLLQNLRARQPASLEVCTMFNRPQRRLIDIPIAYKGFDLPDLFVVGYGLDFRERYRNLPFVGVLQPEVLSEGSNGRGNGQATKNAPAR